MSRFSKFAPKQAQESDQDLDHGISQTDIGLARQASVTADSFAMDDAEEQRALEAAARRREETQMSTTEDLAAAAAAPTTVSAPVEEPVSVAPETENDAVPVESMEAPPQLADEPRAEPEPAAPRDVYGELSDTMRAILPAMPRVDQDSTPQLVMATFRELKNTAPELHEELRLAAGEFATAAMAAIKAGDPEADLGSSSAAAFRQDMGVSFVAGGLSLLDRNGARTNFDNPVIDRIMNEHLERFTSARTDLYRKTAAAPPGWDESRAVPLRKIRLDSPGADTAHQARYAGNAVITNGDPLIASLDPELSEREPPPPPEPENSFASRFPGAPEGWPKMQAWPQQPTYDLMEAAKASDEQIAQYMATVFERAEKMRLRAQQIEEYLREHNDPQKMQRFAGVPAFRRTGRERSNQRDVVKYGDEHHGVKWAMLLDDDVPARALNIATSWGFNTVATNDGGIVVADDNFLKFQKVTPGAIHLAMLEGKARGWGSFNMTGNKEFCQTAIQAAREMNMPAKISERYGPLGMWTRVHHITPAPPGSKKPPEVQTEDLGAGANRSMTSTPDGTDLSEAGGIAPPRPDVAKKSRPKRLQSDPALDEPERDPSEPFEGPDPRSLVEEDPDDEMQLHMVNTGIPRPRSSSGSASFDLG